MQTVQRVGPLTKKLKMEKVEVYKTKDGIIFQDYEQARMHEDREKHKPEIDAFIASKDCKYKKGPHKKIVENAILSWIFWQTDRGPQ